MANFECPKLQKCPIFAKDVLHNDMVGKTYKTLYCLSKSNKHLTCKRYLVSEKYKKPVPESILPNTQLSVEEIGKRLGFI